MCGHGIIALTKVVLDTGLLPVEGPETVIRIDTPAGQIEAKAQVTDGHVGSVAFRNVPSFVAAMDRTVDLPAWAEFDTTSPSAAPSMPLSQRKTWALSIEPSSISRLIDA